MLSSGTEQEELFSLRPCPAHEFHSTCSVRIQRQLTRDAGVVTVVQQTVRKGKALVD
jgi:hypothetical protein